VLHLPLRGRTSARAGASSVSAEQPPTPGSPPTSPSSPVSSLIPRSGGVSSKRERTGGGSLVGTVKSVTRTNPISGGKRVELACLDGKPADDVQVVYQRL
jgi:hypothetical protein